MREEELTGMAARRLSALTWEELSTVVARHSTAVDPVNGPTNSQARLRLFGTNGASPDQVRVTLFRDNHAWCPYCQKVWLWLEEMRVPYRVEKVTMFCYGEKEAWYKRKVVTIFANNNPHVRSFIPDPKVLPTFFDRFPRACCLRSN